MSDQYSKEIILKYMRESLKEIIVGSHYGLVNSVLKKMVDAGLVDKPQTPNLIEYYNHICNGDKKLEALIVECYTYLIIHGIIIPMPSTPQYGTDASWNSYKITEYGKIWVSSDKEPIPEDINGFLSFIRENIFAIDDVVIQYISESLNTFNAQYLFASAVMLGAAAEKIVYLLADAIENATSDPKLKRDIKEASEYRKLYDLFKKVSDTLEKLIAQGKISYAVHEGSNHYMFSLFNAIRIQRNNAVHPIAGEVKSNQLRLLLLSFPHACKKAYDFLIWLKTNQI